MGTMGTHALPLQGAIIRKGDVLSRGVNVRANA